MVFLFLASLLYFLCGEGADGECKDLERAHQNSKCVWAPDLGEGQAVCNTSK